MSQEPDPFSRIAGSAPRRSGPPGPAAARARHRSIPKRNGSTPAPLSFIQQRLWIFDRLAPESPVFNRPSNLRLTGPLRVEMLERALSEIVRRHEALHTTFPEEQDGPRQLVGPARPVRLPVLDVSGLPEAERESLTRRRMAEEAVRPFDLSSGPLFRASLLRLGDRDHMLLVTVHHIVFDAWSMDVFQRELDLLYEAFSDGRPSPLPEPPIQYSDFAAWQREQVEGKALEDSLSYWKGRLGGAPPLLELPTDRTRPAVESHQGAMASLRLSAPAAEGLKALGRQEGATLFMTILAAFSVLLSRYVGRDDIVVGAPVAGRTRAETEGLIGCFINTLVLRIDLSGTPTFAQLLRRVRAVTLEALAYQDLPFERLVEALQPKISLAHSPLFQVMVNFRNVPVRTAPKRELRMERIGGEPPIAMVDLTLDVQERPDGLDCRFLYNTDLFETVTVARMAGHFEALLEAIVADPGRRFSELLLLTPAERHRLLGGEEEELAGLVAAVKSLSDEEAERLLDAGANESERNAGSESPGALRN